jgi:hypothetical protein
VRTEWVQKALEVCDLIQTIWDPEKPMTLRELKIVTEQYGDSRDI